MVRNSPLGRRKAGGYSPVEVATEDPFVQGIAFNAHFVASIESPDTTGTEAVQDAISAVLDETQKSKKSLRKIKFIIRAVSLTVKDVADKTEITYPIYLVSYCGNSRDANTVFYILHKSKIDRITRAEIFKCDSPAKVGAISRTVSKAFNVAYKAWCTKKRMNEKKLGMDSPLLKRATASDVPKKDNAQKPSEGVPQQFHTPPIPRKDSSPEKDAAAGVRRSGSFGEKDAPGVIISPNMQRVKVQNEVTGEIDACCRCIQLQ